MVRDQVVAAWNDGGHVTPQVTQLFQRWKEISRALIAVDQKKKKWDKIDDAKAIKNLEQPPIRDAACFIHLHGFRFSSPPWEVLSRPTQ